MTTIKQEKKEFDRLKEQRSTWNNMFQIIGEYVGQFKQNFNASPTPGEFLIEDIYDSTAIFAAQNSASALLGMIWPGTAVKALSIEPPDDMETDTELANFYAMATKRFVIALDDPQANVNLTFDEYMNDQVQFGTSGIGVERGTASKLLLKPYGVKEAYIDEGQNGAVDKVYLFYEWEINRVVADYGIKNVSEEVRKKHESGSGGEKIKILHIIKKRKDFKAEAGALAMPYMSLHIEYDTEKKLKESGFTELPIRFGRIRKMNYEKYGRSFAMSALPDIREANVLREAIIRATEKVLDPPLGILDDGMLGGGTVDTSASAINVFNGANNMNNRPPVFPIVTIGDMNAALRRLEALEQSISRHFLIDRLLDFNNETEMTLGEVQIRDQIRTASISPLFSRQLSEVFTHVFERAFNILWRDGEFGVIRGSDEEQALLDQGVDPEYIPNVIAERLERGEEIYKVVYKTKAANAQRAEEYMATLEIMGQYRQDIQISPQIKNRVDVNQAYKIMADIRGVRAGLIREDDAVLELDKKDQEQLAKAQGLQGAEQMAGAADKFASAKLKSAQSEKEEI